MKQGWILLLICNIGLAQTPIDISDTLTIGGIKQFVTIKGKDTSNPVLLFLHGGPGNSVMSYANKFTGKLQEKFIVVQWDQRQAGKTFKLNASPEPLTVNLFVNDTHELIEILLQRFNQKKLYLAGHSWGTVLGFLIAKQYPDLLFAYMPISPVVNQLESERIILNLMKDKAQQSNDTVQIKELSTVDIPFKSGTQLYYHRKWLFRYSGQQSKVTKSFVETWASTWLTVWNEASSINFIESLPEIKCPVYFFIGRKDYQTNFKIVEDYYNKVQAPKKQIFWFERTGHPIPSSQPTMLQSIIIDKVLSETL